VCDVEVNSSPRLSTAAARDRAHRPTQPIFRATTQLSHPRNRATHELIEFLARRAVRGVEAVEDGTYRRSLRLCHGAGVVELTPADDAVRCELHLDDPRDEAEALTAARRTLRLDVDPRAIADRLGGDPVIGALVRAAPGRRIPGHHDPFELAVRAVLGQQISVEAAATLAARLVAMCGDALPEPTRGVTHVWPSPEWFARLDPEHLPMPRARGRTLVALGGVGGTDRLSEVPGVGPWTASYVALRSGDDDAFLPTDLGVRHGLAALGQDPRRAAEVAEAWRPLRALGVAHLWATPPRRPSPRARA
jgi:AraC family transcriptional regulator, regulatory protein of adaptative response / DNA-3-methyladenine glycosylase II